MAITTEPHARVRSISCPPISIPPAQIADLHVLPPTPPSKAAQMIELQPPQSQAQNVLGLKKCWQNIIILSDPDKFNAKTVEHAEREVRLGITKIDHTQLSRESASLILQRLHQKTDHQASQLAAQNLKMEELSAQVAHWKSTAKQLNDKNKQLKTACDVLAAADKSRAELLQDVQELYEEKKKLQTQFQKTEQRLANEREYAAQQLEAATQKLSAATAQLHETERNQKLQEDDFQRSLEASRDSSEGSLRYSSMSAASKACQQLVKQRFE
jgi:chromosome segregation ATPase